MTGPDTGGPPSGPKGKSSAALESVKKITANDLGDGARQVKTGDVDQRSA